MESTQNIEARIVEQGPHPLVATDLSGTIIFVNYSGRAALGLQDSQIGALAMREILVESAESMSWDTMLDKLKRHETVRCPVTVRCGEKGDKAATLIGFALEDDGEEPETLVFLVHENASGALLGEETARRNIEMAKVNSELIRSNTELRRLSELKSSFLSIASHELKTPLTTIKGYSDIIMDTMRDQVNPSVLRMVENINRAANRLHRVVNNILDVARIEQKRLRLQLESFDLRELVKEAVDEVAETARARAITFQCQFADGLPEHFADKSRIQQVLVNLLGNAAKFSPDNTQVDVIVRLEDARTFHVVVKDHGIGIDRADQKRIFDPFYEVGSATKHSSHASKFMGSGTGLGLSIVRGIVEFHGGRVWAESSGTRENEFPGSEFHVQLPVRTVVDDPAGKDPLLKVMIDESAGPDDTLAIIEAKPRVLLIEGDKESREEARQVLESVFDVISAENGQEGLALAFRKQPSLVLLESDVGGVDAFRICSVLRNQQDTREIPIAFLLSSTSEEHIQKCFASGADDVVFKPFTKSELMDKIWRILMKKKEDAQFR